MRQLSAARVAGQRGEATAENVPSRVLAHERKSVEGSGSVVKIVNKLLGNRVVVPNVCPQEAAGHTIARDVQALRFLKPEAAFNSVGLNKVKDRAKQIGPPRRQAEGHVVNVGQHRVILGEASQQADIVH
jgi:hypothetical protein